MHNNIPVVNPLNNRKNINAGNKLKIGVENDFHNIKADGTYTNSRALPSGEKINTKYSGSIGVKFEDGKKGISGWIGKLLQLTEVHIILKKEMSILFHLMQIIKMVIKELKQVMLIQ